MTRHPRLSPIRRAAIPRSMQHLLAVAALSMGAACAAAPGPAAAPLPAPVGPAPAHVHPPDVPHATPDAAFLQHMIPHHAQALVMTAMVPARTQRADLRLMAERIAVSQQDEIAQMQGWLRARGAAVPQVPAGDAAHAGHALPAPGAPAMHDSMPGMLGPAELARLEAARGPAFDRLFLELMIRHHEGAITMVRTLFAAGGGQDSQVYAIASDVESDQRMEIARMQAMLAGMPSVSPRRD